MSANRKARVRDRLKAVDSVIQVVQSSGVQCTALVGFQFASQKGSGSDSFPHTCRAKHYNYLLSLKCLQRISIQPSPGQLEVTESQYTRLARARPVFSEIEA